MPVCIEEYLSRMRALLSDWLSDWQNRPVCIIHTFIAGFDCPYDTGGMNPSVCARLTAATSISVALLVSAV